jgi:hypothetical protein
MSIEVTGAQLLELLHDAAALPPHAELLRLVDTWAEEYDRCKKLDTEDRCNLLCVLLQRSEAAESAEAAETSIAADAADTFDLRTTLGHAAAHVLLCEKFPLSEYEYNQRGVFFVCLFIERTSPLASTKPSTFSF